MCIIRYYWYNRRNLVGIKNLWKYFYFFFDFVCIIEWINLSYIQKRNKKIKISIYKKVIRFNAGKVLCFFLEYGTFYFDSNLFIKWQKKFHWVYQYHVLSSLCERFSFFTSVNHNILKNEIQGNYGISDYCT